MKIFSALVLLLVLAAFPARSEQNLFLTTEDVPRGTLGEMDAQILEPGTKGVGIPFIFPTDVREDYVYGIDISHHSFGRGVVFDWMSLPSSGIYYVYAKATQGERFVDKTFESTWKALKTPGAPRRGAYHFLTAGGRSDEQAKHFVAAIVSAGGFEQSVDMPPVVDLEWDCKVSKGRVVLNSNGRCVDQWAGIPPADIVEKVTRFSAIVHEALGVKPIIYTAASWWNEVGLTTELSDHQLWVADYTKNAQRIGKPRVPRGYQSVIWQFTDNSKVHEKCDPIDAKKRDLCTDANIFFGNKEQFHKAFGLR